MSDPDTNTKWAIVRDDAEFDPDVQFLTEDQEWGPIEAAMIFDTEVEASNGAETLCPPFMPGHPQPVTDQIEPISG